MDFDVSLTQQSVFLRPSLLLHARPTMWSWKLQFSRHKNSINAQWKSTCMGFKQANSNVDIFWWNYSAAHQASSRGTPVAEHWPRPWYRNLCQLFVLSSDTNIWNKFWLSKKLV